MEKIIYVFIHNEWIERANEIYKQVKGCGADFLHLTTSRELMLTIDALLEEYDRVIVDLPADDIGLACATAIADIAFGLSWTTHYSIQGYCDYKDAIKKVMKI